MRHFFFAMRLEPVSIGVPDSVFELLGVSVAQGVKLSVADASTRTHFRVPVLQAAKHYAPY